MVFSDDCSTSKVTFCSHVVKSALECRKGRFDEILTKNLSSFSIGNVCGYVSDEIFLKIRVVNQHLLPIF